MALLSLTPAFADTLLNVFLAIAVDNLANAQELTKVELVGGCFRGKVTTCSWQIRTIPGSGGGEGGVGGGEGQGSGPELLPWMHCSREKAPSPPPPKIDCP